MRLVPPQTIFELSDGTGSVKVLVNEQVQVTEGSKIELVGKYMPIPDPMQAGSGQAPQENFFVSERYLVIP